MLKVIISGGGTGGHIFPAIAIADAIKQRYPEAQILFVGAEGKMEMERVPKAGYQIEGLPVVGFQRKLTLKNLLFPFKLLRSLWKARSIVKRFRPDAAIGVGGYASGPTLRVATGMGIKTIIQEQNSFAGVTNRILGAKVDRVCVAYEQVKRFFPAGKTVLTGNPVRADIVQLATDTALQAQLKAAAYQHFGLTPGKKTVLITGGSLGARTLNEGIINGIEALQANSEVQVLWQCGKVYYQQCKPLAEGKANLVLVPFLDRMDLAYAVADVVVARAGALTISELCVMGKPSILIPSPNVSEDHQTANAKALVDVQAAVMLADSVAPIELMSSALNLMGDERKLNSLSVNIQKLGISDAAQRIVNELDALLQKH